MKTKSVATKSKPGATKSKENATKSKLRFWSTIETFQTVTRFFAPFGGSRLGQGESASELTTVLSLSSTFTIPDGTSREHHFGSFVNILSKSRRAGL
jgi:hypothetical protein